MLRTRQGTTLKAAVVRVRRFADHIPGYASAEAVEGGPGALLAEREDGAILALLRDTKLQRDFVAATAHLHWDPRWPDVKLLQV